MPFGPHIASVLMLTSHAAAAPTRSLIRDARSSHSGGPPRQPRHHQPDLPSPRTRGSASTIPDGVAPPRVHDLRHSFAVGTLLRWYRSGVDPSATPAAPLHLPGPRSPASTAVYLTVTRALLDEASRRFETGPARLSRRPCHDRIARCLVHAFLVDELPLQKGLRPASVKAYRDGLRLFLVLGADDLTCRLTQVSCEAFRSTGSCGSSRTSKSAGTITVARAITA